ELILRYAPDAPRGVYGDPGRVRQVLVNLVGNAIKFTSEGHVLVDVSWSGSEAGAGRFRMAVEDTGIGIAEDKLLHMFEKFTQADSSTTRNYGGTGLGLSISRELTSLMGGELSVESRLGSGSTFWASLPARLANEIDPAPRLGVPRTVFLVTPCFPLRETLRERLQAMGAHVVATDSASALRERLALEHGRRFDIGLVDYRLGDEELRRIAAWARTAPATLGSVLHLMAPMMLRDEATLQLGEGYERVFAKPLRERRLFDLLAAEPRAVQGPRPSSEATHAEIAPAHVLLVEDEPVNQKVASSMLRRLGHHVDIVGNGEQAVERLLSREGGHYDVVFMDCQMPVLDGYEATRRIRHAEQGGNRPHQVIVALTASALESDREKCVAAGMDDFLAKPIRLEDIGRALARWVGSAPEPWEAPHTAETRPVKDAFDRDSAFATVGEDEELLWTIVDLFLEGWEELEDRLDQALADADADELKAVAHRLRGSAANVGARAVHRVAGELEPRFAKGDLTVAVQGVAQLKQAMSDFREATHLMRPAGI
ncbi:MAG: response regulator, partial [Gemmatimonadetes bacterium]|nr:response regulator [Gemmatimonadota bacterium]